MIRSAPGEGINRGVADRTEIVSAVKPRGLDEIVMLLLPAMERACAEKLSLEVVESLARFTFVLAARERGWSVRGMARKLGCSPSTVTTIVARGRQLVPASRFDDAGSRKAG